MPVLIALAGAARSGKGTCARVIQEMALARGLTFRERQLSGPGKHHLARIFRPAITEQDAIDWFESLKDGDTFVSVLRDRSGNGSDDLECIEEVSLRQFLQNGLQAGGRDLWGDDFWIDMLLPLGGHSYPLWTESFEVMDGPAPICADVCLISDLRQVDEARRVHELGGTVHELVRPCSSGHGPDHHVTEQRLPPSFADEILMNDGDLDDLRDAVHLHFEFVLDEVMR